MDAVHSSAIDIINSDVIKYLFFRTSKTNNKIKKILGISSDATFKIQLNRKNERIKKSPPSKWYYLGIATKNKD